MVTTADIAEETGLGQRTIQKRIFRLGLEVKFAGPVMLLTESQAEKVKTLSSKPGPKNGLRKVRNGKSNGSGRETKRG